MKKFYFGTMAYYISEEDLDKIKNNTKTLYISTHVYDPQDVLGNLTIANQDKKKKYYHIASNNPMTKFCHLYTKFFTNSNVILIKNNTVQKAVDRLNQNDNVFIYILPYKSLGNGVYNIHKLTNCKLFFVRIKPMPDTIIHKIKGTSFMFKSKFKVELEEIETLPDKDDFKKKLYNFPVDYNIKKYL